MGDFFFGGWSFLSLGLLQLLNFPGPIRSCTVKENHSVTAVIEILRYKHTDGYPIHHMSFVALHDRPSDHQTILYNLWKGVTQKNQQPILNSTRENRISPIALRTG